MTRLTTFLTSSNRPNLSELGSTLMPSGEAPIKAWVSCVMHPKSSTRVSNMVSYILTDNGSYLCPQWNVVLVFTTCIGSPRVLELEEVPSIDSGGGTNATPFCATNRARLAGVSNARWALDAVRRSCLARYHASVRCVGWGRARRASICATMSATERGDGPQTRHSASVVWRGMHMVLKKTCLQCSTKSVMVSVSYSPPSSNRSSNMDSTSSAVLSQNHSSKVGSENIRGSISISSSMTARQLLAACAKSSWSNTLGASSSTTRVSVTSCNSLQFMGVVLLLWTWTFVFILIVD